MKNPALFYLLLLSILSQPLTAQYQPIAVEGAQWIVYETFDEGFSGQSITHHNYFIRGDTLLDGQNYKKVYLRYLSNEVTGGPQNLVPPYYVSTPATLAGLLRDSVAAREVYGVSYIEPVEDVLNVDCSYPERLLYDFKSAVGDTLQGCWHTSTWTWNGTTYIESIIVDSIGTADWLGLDNRVFYLPEANPVYPRLIEGVGGDNGPFTYTTADIGFVGWQYEVLVDYCIGTDVECGLEPTSTQNAANPIGLYVYPNPSNGETLFVGANVNCAERLQATLYDALGRRVWQSASAGCADFPLKIPTAGLGEGAYYLALRGAFGVATRRVVVR